MNTVEVYVGVGVGIVTIGGAVVKVSVTIGALTEAVKGLAERFDKIDERMYDNAIRGTERRR